MSWVFFQRNEDVGSHTIPHADVYRSFPQHHPKLATPQTAFSGVTGPVEHYMAMKGTALLMQAAARRYLQRLTLSAKADLQRLRPVGFRYVTLLKCWNHRNKQMSGRQGFRKG